MYMKGTILQDQARKHLESEMKKVVSDPEMQKRLVPDFPVGCKRILPSGDQFLHVSRVAFLEPLPGDSQYTDSFHCIGHQRRQRGSRLLGCEVFHRNRLHQ